MKKTQTPPLPRNKLNEPPNLGNVGKAKSENLRVQKKGLSSSRKTSESQINSQDKKVEESDYSSSSTDESTENEDIPPPKANLMKLEKNASGSWRRSIGSLSSLRGEDDEPKTRPRTSTAEDIFTSLKLKIEATNGLVQKTSPKLSPTNTRNVQVKDVSTYPTIRLTTLAKKKSTMPDFRPPEKLAPLKPLPKDIQSTPKAKKENREIKASPKVSPVNSKPPTLSTKVSSKDQVQGDIAPKKVANKATSPQKRSDKEKEEDSNKQPTNKKKAAKPKKQSSKVIILTEEVIILTCPDGTHLDLNRVYGRRAKHNKFMIVVHGYGEYGLLYHKSLQLFIDSGYDMLFLSLRGHGKSDGMRGVVREFDDYLIDLNAAFQVAYKVDRRKRKNIVSWSKPDKL